MTNTDLIERLKDLRRFLDGSGDLEGRSFGERHPIVAGAFWWRRHLTRIDKAAAALTETNVKLVKARAELKASEQEVIERVINRMGWPEIHAFHERIGQDVYEDAGGFMIRKIKRLFGIKRDAVQTYQEAARATLAELEDGR